MNKWGLSLSLLLLLMLACAPFTAFKPAVTNTPALEVKTGEIHGNVFDSSSGESVSIAGVSTDPPTSSVTTGAKGDYSIPDIPPGDYTVMVTKSGYESASVEVAVVAGKITTADLHLIAKSTNALSTSTADPGLDDGLVAYYPFNSNANDESGNGNHGTVYGVTLAEDRFGKENSAYFFDGADDLIQIDDFSLSYDSLSISAWVLLISQTPKDPQIIGTPNGGRAFQLEIGGVSRVDGGKNARNSIMWDCATNSQRLRTSANLFEPRTWHFVAGTYDGNQSSIYYDGKLVASGPANASIDLTDATIRIGSEVTGDHSFWHGFIDDIRIYDRALSASEIQALYSKR